MNEEALDSAFAALKKGKAVGWDNLSKEIIQMIPGLYDRIKLMMRYLLSLCVSLSVLN
jgi:hypothetical protein